jgi:hypothetical protein
VDTSSTSEANQTGTFAGHVGENGMSSDVIAFRAITAALGFFLIGKLLFDYFKRSPRVRNHQDQRVRQLNRLRVSSILISFGSIAVATLASMAGLPFVPTVIIFGIAILAALVYLVCTVRVILITGHL